MPAVVALLLRADEMGEGLLQAGAAETACPPCPPHPPHCARTHPGAQACAHARRRTRRAVLVLSFFCDLRVITALSPPPSSGTHGCGGTHSSTTHSHRRPRAAPATPNSHWRTQHILRVNCHTSAHRCIFSWGTAAEVGTPVRVKRTPHSPQQHSLPGVDPTSQPGGQGPQLGALALFPEEMPFWPGEVVSERHADLASIALRLGFLICKAGMHAASGRSQRGWEATRGPGCRLMCVKAPGRSQLLRKALAGWIGGRGAPWSVEENRYDQACSTNLLHSGLDLGTGASD